ncbi:MAG: GGDEF domain-containing protein [Actinomycetota bacterium]|nr:GGDEF domain-containing protein [Actinomycetota bacterium]
MEFFAGSRWRLFPNVDTGASSPSLNAERKETHLSTATREYPTTLGWAGGVLLLMTVLTFIGEPSHGFHTHYFRTHVTDLCVALLLFVSAWLLSTERVPRSRRSWIFTFNALVLVITLLWQVSVEGTALNYTYAMFVIVAFGATVLSTVPFLCGAGLMIAAASVTAWQGPVGHTFDWILVAITAAGIGAILLRIRLQSIIALADATALAKDLANQDQLTGVLNRHGLLEHVPALWDKARGSDDCVFVAFIDIRGLKKANDKFGHDYGDGLILSAAQAIKGSIRPSDLLSRWGGDEFLVVGLGNLHDAEQLTSGLRSSEGQEVLNSEMGGLSIGIAAGNPQRDSLSDLTSRADEDMYRRRTADRPSQ